MSDTANERELLMAALSETARSMSDADWNLFVAQTRPTDYSQYRDPADRARAGAAAIAVKQHAAKQQQTQPRPQLSQADRDALGAQIKSAQESGNFAASIALKQQLRTDTDVNGNALREGTAS